ncbi:luciferase-like domain-containing protein [Leucosporidium creatinivorum]|uniref:Luciferase-like domain-containing protein n=1 Tax=Leucosporidium creatinivorum TaxID=106004 RepID=A0A1Y2D8V7_9BASI|nr:luciferase-like domain-containing protein [Leucosporidium creatinivorum]
MQNPAFFAAPEPTKVNDAPSPSAESPAKALKKRWILNAFDMASAGHVSPGLWKHPDDRSTTKHDLEYWIKLAELLERGKFNSVFIADVLGCYSVYGNSLDAATRTGAQWGVDDPMVIVSAMAAGTNNLSFGVTHSVTYDAPYALARRFSTLDHLTRGRVGFNLVTSYLDSAARNFGLEQQIEHDERYIRAHEYIEVLYKLWLSSWREDAVVLDKERDVYAEPDRIRKIHHKGKYFNVEGPSIVEPSPQGLPLLYQAGSSSSGLGFGARHAEAVFMSGPSPQKIRSQVDALRSAAAQEGRDPQSIKVLCQQLIIVDETDEKAQAKLAEYEALASREGAKVLFGGWLGQDLAEYGPDDDLREVGPPPLAGVVRGFAAIYPEVTKWTADALADKIKLGGMNKPVVGSAQIVADKLEEFVEVADIDGFNFAYAITPGSFEDIVEYLVPELQRRGVHWSDYPTREDGKPLTAREGLYGVGQEKLRDDHYAAKYRWKAGEEAPALE